MKPIKVGRDLIAPRSIFSITDVVPAEVYTKSITGKIRVEVQTTVGVYPLDLDHEGHVALVEAWRASLERREVVVVRIDDRVSITTDADDYLDVRTRSDS